MWASQMVPVRGIKSPIYTHYSGHKRYREQGYSRSVHTSDFTGITEGGGATQPALLATPQLNVKLVGLKWGGGHGYFNSWVAK